MTGDNFNLYCQFVLFCGKALDDMPFSRLQEFCNLQWSIVERALILDEGIRACDSRAHDVTCGFVEHKLFNSIYAE